MKFSISFKYSNVVFKNKETKETVSFDTKAETGNTFTFDNVDEDVVLGMVKGIKDRKASQVFAYDDLRTNFVNVLARNKCKELYDKIDKGGWKVDDVVISTITIKDLEFTKPTMNARENITVESRKMKRKMNEVKKADNKSPEKQMYNETIYNDIDKCLKERDYLIDVDDSDVPLIATTKEGFCFYVDVRPCEYDWDERDMNVNGFAKESNAKKVFEGRDKVEVDFKKTPDDGTVIAFFPETMHDGSCNPGNIMSYEHNGQHGEASIDFYHDCTNCFEEDYASLLHELEGIYDDCDLVVVQEQD